MIFRSSLVACLGLQLAACASVPMAVLTSNGHTFRGSYTASSPERFQVSDGRITCTGLVKVETTIVECNHGLKGIATIRRGSAFSSGGVLRLSDGSTGTFVTGDDAARL